MSILLLQGQLLGLFILMPMVEFYDGIRKQPKQKFWRLLMVNKTEQTEVVKIRLGLSEKLALESIAERECRTFAAQVRLAVREWLESRSAPREEKQ